MTQSGFDKNVKDQLCKADMTVTGLNHHDANWAEMAESLRFDRTTRILLVHNDLTGVRVFRYRKKQYQGFESDGCQTEHQD